MASKARSGQDLEAQYRQLVEQVPAITYVANASSGARVWSNCFSATFRSSDACSAGNTNWNDDPDTVASQRAMESPRKE